jgi:hypothetical protein
MSPKDYAEKLQVDEDMAFQHREWMLQRVGWIFMLVFLIAALAGALGSGPASNQTAGSSKEQLQVEYHRFIHYADPMILKFEIGPFSEEEEEIRLAVDAKYVEGVEVQRISPEPNATEISQQANVYVFKTRKSKEAIKVQMHVTPEVYGKLRGKMSVNEGPAVNIEHFVYP